MRHLKGHIVGLRTASDVLRKVARIDPYRRIHSHLLIRNRIVAPVNFLPQKNRISSLVVRNESYSRRTIAVSGLAVSPLSIGRQIPAVATLQ